MDVKVYDEPFSYVVIDNTHTENEINKIFKELSYLKEFFLLPENSGSATDDDGNLLKKNKALFINEFYTKRKFSHILTAEDRFLDESHLPSMIPDDCYWELMQRTNQHSTLVSYYENSDYYQPHRDRSHFTMLTWLWKEPKRS